MQEAWIQIQCPACEKQWEANPADLPEPGDEFTCEYCEETRTVSEFAKTVRDFEILDNFHAS